MNKQSIQYCSDLHLEFTANENYLLQNPLVPKSEILILAGDILPFKLLDKRCLFLDWCADNFETTYWLPGNHEYYHFDAADKSGEINEKVRSNVFLVNNQSIYVKGIRILFSILWSKISPVNHWSIQKNISDFYLIKFNKGNFTPEHFNELHEHCVQFLSNAFEQEHAGKTVVVTHHVPTLLNYPQQYRHSELNEAFAVELYDFILNVNADYWIYGHHHTNTPAFKIGNTTLLTNQLGYVNQNEHLSFNPSAVINI